MADQAEGLVGLGEGFEQGNGVAGFGEVPERAVAAGIEEAVVVLGLYLGELDGIGQRLLRLGIVLEALGGLGLGVGGVALGSSGG